MDAVGKVRGLETFLMLRLERGDLRLADLDFEAFPCRELTCDIGVGEESIKLLINRAESHDGNIIREFREIFLDLVHCLVVDPRAIGIVNRAMAASEYILVRQ